MKPSGVPKLNPAAINWFIANLHNNSTTRYVRVRIVLDNGNVAQSVSYSFNYDENCFTFQPSTVTIPQGRTGTKVFVDGCYSRTCKTLMEWDGQNLQGDIAFNIRICPTYTVEEGGGTS